MTLFLYCWEILVNILESSSVVFFMDDKMNPSTNIKPNHIRLYKYIFVILSSLGICLFNYWEIPFQICFICSFVFTSLYAYVFYESKLSTKIFFSSIYLAILVIADLLGANIPRLFFHSKLSSSLAGGALRIPSTLTYLVCIAVLIFISHFIHWKTFSMSPCGTIFYILICLVGFFFGEFILSTSIQSFSMFNSKSFSNRLILIATVYSIIFLFLIAYIYLLNITKERNRTLEIEKQQLVLEETDYKNLIENTENLRKLKHDMKHHLSAIQYLFYKKDYDKLDEYLQEYIGTFDETYKFISTGNTAIDCILSTYIPKAENIGINVDYSIIMPKSFKLDSILISALLGNLWSNSIEACELLLVKGTNPFIKFNIKPVENMLFISIENSYNGSVNKDCNGNYLSTKPEKHHGLGLKRILEIVEQNDGLLEITDFNNLFCVHIMFPLEEMNIYENSNSRR